MATKKNSASRAHSISTVFHDFREDLHCAAADPDKKTVHHLRTNTRRIESMVQHLLPPDSEKELMQELKKVRRAAGEIRDLDVLSKLTGEFDSKNAGSIRGRAFVSARLDLLRAKHEKAFLQMLDPERIKSIESTLKSCEHHLQASAKPASDGAETLDRALAQYTDLVRQFEPLDAGNLHEFRKSCKHLRYLAELSSDGTRKEHVLEQFKRIQDSVGDWHDVIILMETSREALKNPNKSPFLTELQQLREGKLETALKETEDAKHELLRLQLQVMASPRKRPQASGKGKIAGNRRQAAS